MNDKHNIIMRLISKSIKLKSISCSKKYLRVFLWRTSASASDLCSSGGRCLVQVKKMFKRLEKPSLLIALFWNIGGTNVPDAFEYSSSADSKYVSIVLEFCTSIEPSSLCTTNKLLSRNSCSQRSWVSQNGAFGGGY